MSISTQPAARQVVRRASVIAAFASVVMAAAGPVAGPADAVAVAAKAKPRTADVVVTSVGRAPASAKPGARFALAVGVRNQGRATSRATRVVVRLSRDGRATSSDAVVGSATAPALRAGRAARVSSKVRVPATASAATYRLFVCTPRRCTPAGAVKVVGGTPVPPKPGAVSGSLHGDLYLVDKGDEVEGSHSTHWKHDAHLSIQMKVSGPDTADATFASTGSEYAYTGAAKETMPSGDCTRVVDETRTGGARLAWNNDPYKDDIAGDFVLLDMSKIRVTVSMRYDDAVSDVTSGPANCAYSSHDTQRALDIEDMKLTQVGRTATTVTYKVSSIVGAYNVPSEWDQVDGTLVLDLD